MTEAGSNVGAPSGEYVFDVVGLGIGSATEQFVNLCTSAGFTVVAVGPNRFRLARVYRPTWATVVAACTALAAGLGLLFLLVKRTDTAEGTIIEDRSGVRLRVTGSLPAELAERIRRSLQPAGSARSALKSPEVVTVLPVLSPPAAPAVHQTFAPPVASIVTTSTDATVHKATLLGSAGTTESGATLQLPSGRSIKVGAGAVIGRAPMPDPRLPSALLYPIEDPSLSKTHLSVGASADGVWVTDLHSRNGTHLIQHGVQHQCTPGERVHVPFGAQIIAGELHILVVNS